MSGKVSANPGGARARGATRVRALGLLLSMLVSGAPSADALGLDGASDARCQTDAGLVPHIPIVIMDDVDFTRGSSGVIGGTGTADDPYLICGWNIVPPPGFNGISISNTRSHVVVKNNWVHNMNVTVRLNIAFSDREPICRWSFWGNVGGNPCPNIEYEPTYDAGGESKKIAAVYSENAAHLRFEGNRVSDIHLLCAPAVVCTGLGFFLRFDPQQPVPGWDPSGDNLWPSGLLFLDQTDLTVRGNVVERVGASPGSNYALFAIGNGIDFEENTFFSNPRDFFVVEGPGLGASGAPAPSRLSVRDNVGDNVASVVGSGNAVISGNTESWSLATSGANEIRDNSTSHLIVTRTPGVRVAGNRLLLDGAQNVCVGMPGHWGMCTPQVDDLWDTCDCGRLFIHDSNEAVVTGNWIERGPLYGVLVSQSTGVAVTGNHIVGNGGDAVATRSSQWDPDLEEWVVIEGAPVDGTMNWWGCPEGPGASGCDNAAPGVLTEPWANAPFLS